MRGNQMIPYGRQEITQSDIDSVVQVLRSDFLTQGPAVPAFERLVRKRVGARYAVAVNSATSALHIACLALGLRRGDLLWTVPNTFVASANCGRYCGADVDFVDIDSRTWNMDIALLKQKLLRAKRENRLPKIVIPVHFGGQPTSQEDIWQLAKEYGFRVLEDASHSAGAVRNGEPVGSCRWSDITVFSFHPVKIITTAEGGMALTNSGELAERMSMLRSHGITREKSLFQFFPQAKDKYDIQGMDAPAWYYEQQELGFNYRMSDLHAALGCSQLGRLDDIVDRRNYLARRYDDLLKRLPLRSQSIVDGNRSSYHLYVVRLTGSERAHRDVFEELRRRGIGVNVHYAPVHLQPYYRNLGFSWGQFPQSEAYARSAFSLPLFPSLSEDRQDEVVNAIRDVL